MTFTISLLHGMEFLRSLIFGIRMCSNYDGGMRDPSRMFVVCSVHQQMTVFIISFSYELQSSFTLLIAVRSTHLSSSRILGIPFTRSLFSIQRDSCPPLIPSPRDTVLSLLSPSAQAFLLHKQQKETPSEPYWMSMCRVLTVDWTDSEQRFQDSEISYNQRTGFV